MAENKELRIEWKERVLINFETIFQDIPTQKTPRL
jgi:hypothetical protein